MTISKFDKMTCKTVAGQAEAALQTAAADLGLSVQYAGGKYEEGKFTCKFAFRIADPNASAAIERREFEQLCGMFGLSPTHYGAALTIRQQPHTLIGFDLSRPKYPIRVRRLADGAVRLFTRDILARVQIAA
jgi:hypothetical protein